MAITMEMCNFIFDDPNEIHPKWRINKHLLASYFLSCTWKCNSVSANCTKHLFSSDADRITEERRREKFISISVGELDLCYDVITIKQASCSAYAQHKTTQQQILMAHKRNNGQRLERLREYWDRFGVKSDASLWRLQKLFLTDF